VTSSKKTKTATPEPKVAEIEEGAPSTPSATEVEEILKVMTESLPIKLLSPLGEKSKGLLLLCKQLKKRHHRPQHQK
jgi:hypothetical protein